MNPNSAALESLKIDRSRPASAKFPWLGLLLLVCLVGGALWWWWRPKVDSVKVRTAVVREMVAGNAPQTLLNASGYVTARRSATVSSKVMGKVMEVLLEEGMSVKQGQVLARLDDSNVAVGLRLAQARLETARKLREELLPSLEFAKEERDRFKLMRSSNSVSQSDFSKAAAAASELQARSERLAAEVTVAERQVDEWNQQLLDMTLLAPFDGVVTTKNAQPGEIISPMSAGGFTRTGIGTVVDMSSLEIEVDVNESYINRVQAGMAAEAKLDAYADWKIPCKVIAIIPTADRQKATVKVRVGFEKLDPRILPEMGVKVAFQTPPAQAATTSQARSLVIPASAVQKDGAQEIVWVLRENRAERRAISLDRIEREEAFLLSGLAAGETVILQPPAALKDGDTIQKYE